jgi:hypothetical protein
MLITRPWKWSGRRITFDFETRSEADLKQVGAWAYSEHPSTEVICACWGIDNEPTLNWDMRHGSLDIDGSLAALFREIEEGAIIEAHNVAFERSIWYNVCHRRMGWPMPPDEAWRDSMASAAYYAMPMALDALARALGYQGKDPDGTRLISRYSKLHLKTAKHEIPDDEIDRFVAYCKQDVRIEQSISDFLGDLPERELPIFEMDQRINLRGIYLDLEGIENATAVLDQRYEELKQEFVCLTGVSPTQNAKIMEWVAGHNIVLENLQADYLKDLLEEGDLGQGPVRRALQIRLDINKASTKKLDAMARQRGADGRARFQVRYHGAGTGRWTGTGFQPLNLNRGYGDDVEPEDLVSAISARDPRWLDCLYGSAMEAVAKASRHWIQAQAGNKIVAGDFVSIEAVLLACLAGETWKIEAFARKEPIYEIMGCKIHGIDPQIALDLGKKFKEKYKDERQDGKTCLGAGTRVLTKRGWLPILSISGEDQLWDGVEWVTHEGLIYQGRRETIRVLGVEMTPDHEVLTHEGWSEAKEVGSQGLMMRRALEIGSANLPSGGLNSGRWGECSRYGFPVLAEPGSISFQRATFATEKLRGALVALNKLRLLGGKTFGASRTYARMTSTEEGCSIVSPRASLVAAQTGMKTTESAASPSTQSGLEGRRGSARTSRIFLHLRGGITRAWRLTVSTLTGAMSRETSGFIREEKARNGLSRNSRSAFENLKPVYDIANAGPRRRFTILTDDGPLIVHNCELAFGYQGALGAWLKFDDSGRHTDEAIIDICRKWRAEHPMIVKFWAELESAAVTAVAEPGSLQQYRQIGFEMVDDWLSMILPNGKRLWYFRPQLRLVMPKWHEPAQETDEEGNLLWCDDGSPRMNECARGVCRCQPKQQLSYMAQKEGQWKRVSTYGGKLAENATQATSREVLVQAMLRAEAAGYGIIMSVYDEIVAEVPKNFGSDKKFAEIMSQSPDEWAQTDGIPWPIMVDPWEGDRYRK